MSHIYALGLHRFQSSENDVPFFISETRKRLFVTSYRWDKTLATLLGRPPRLPYHYCETSLPLDIEDDLILDQDSSEPLLQQLGPDGWNIKGVNSGTLRHATLLRLRFMISVLLEQVLELSLGRRTPDFTEKLRYSCKDVF